MTQITIRGLPDDVKTRLRVRAAQAGRSMEAEAKAILTESCAPRDSGQGWKDLQDYIQRTWKGKKPKSMVDDLIGERRNEAKREEKRGW